MHISIKKGIFSIVGLILFSHLQTVQAAERIHFITTQHSGADAIVLESNGHFGMIDTGESADYPTGYDSRYPFREGITTATNAAMEPQVNATLKQLQVHNLEFIIGTHVHSDHIGGIPNVLSQVPVDRIFLKKYDDTRITNPTGLWDNQYVYDKALQAAKKYNTPVIQDITEADATFTLGNMSIQLLNYKNEYDENGQLKKVFDDNVNSIIAIITTQNGKRIYLGGDLENYDGHEDKYGPLIGKVDVMKLNHHGFTLPNRPTNTQPFLKYLNPTVIVSTSIYPPSNDFKQWTTTHLNPSIVYYSSGRSDTAALSLDLAGDTIQDVSVITGGVSKTSYGYRYLMFNGTPAPKGWLRNNHSWYLINDYSGSLQTGWYTEKTNRYHFDDTGNLQLGWFKLNEQWFYADAKEGTILTGWHYINGLWYYLDPKEYFMHTGLTEIDHKKYYLDEINGNMRTGWIKHEHQWYYSNASGDLLTGWQLINNKWYFLDTETTALKTGWLKLGQDNYYLDPVNGDMQIGWRRIDKEWYYFHNNGKPAVEWNYINGHWYYLNSQGIMQTGWQKINNIWYFLYTDGSLATHTITPDGYKVDASGAYIP